MPLDLAVVLPLPLLHHVVLCRVQARTRRSCLEPIHLPKQSPLSLLLLQIFKELVVGRSGLVGGWFRTLIRPLFILLLMPFAPLVRGSLKLGALSLNPKLNNPQHTLGL